MPKNAVEKKSVIKAGFKHSSLGPIPVDWEVKTLHECCLIAGQYGINAAAVDYSRDLPTYLRITDIDDDGNYSAEKKVSVNAESFSDYILDKGDIVFARTGATVGKTYLYDTKDGELIFAGFLIRFRPNSEHLLSEYLKAHASTKPYWDWVKIISMRSGQPGINAEEYGSIELPLPPIIEQKAIAQLLNIWNCGIGSVTQLITTKEQRKKWLMQQLLTGKKRLKGFSAPWKRVHIYEIAKEVSDKNNDRKDLTVLSCTKYAGLVPSLEYFGRRVFAEDTTSYKVVKRNQFAYATNHIEEGSIGYQEQFDEALISPMYTVFETDNTVNDKFLYSILKSYHYIHEYQKRMEGSIDRRGGLRWDEFSKIKVPLPTIAEQNAIVAILHAADKELALLRRKLDAYKEQKKGLMQVLLTGKIRLKPNNNGN